MNKLLLPNSQIVALILFFYSLNYTVWAQQNRYLNHLSDYIENVAVFKEGQEPPRAYHIPESSLSLNGEWKFYYSEVSEGIPQDFFETGFDDDSWDQISVPSNWEMQGYGDEMFRNVSAAFDLKRAETAPPDPYAAFRGQDTHTEFVVVPPFVPQEYNPTGAYRKTFSMPDSWRNQEVFLRFEKVASASFVWVNGQEVGYNEGAQEPAEYDITSYLRGCLGFGVSRPNAGFLGSDKEIFREIRESQIPIMDAA